MGRELLLVQPPGQQQILPTEMLADERTESAAAYKQEQRAEGSSNTMRSRQPSWFGAGGAGRAQQQQRKQPGQEIPAGSSKAKANPGASCRGGGGADAGV